MYIDPFVAGVLATLLVELALIVIWGFTSGSKDNKK